MLPGEGEDLLQQLSGELGLPEFLDEVMLDDPNVLGVENIYDSFMDDLPSTTDTKWLSDVNIITNDSLNVFPPSPSNSDSSGTSSSLHDPIMMSPSMLPLEVTPPVSPPGSNMIHSTGTSIVSVPDLASLKLPIPKIQKPSK